MTKSTKKTIPIILGVILGVFLGLLTVSICTGCSLFTSNMQGIAEDLLSGGYKAVHCDPSKILDPQLVGCDPDDQAAIECTVTNRNDDEIVIVVCAEIKVDRE